LVNTRVNDKFPQSANPFGPVDRIVHLACV